MTRSSSKMASNSEKDNLKKVDRQADDPQAGPSRKSGLKSDGVSILEKKEYLERPSRKKLILEHRAHTFQLKQFLNLETVVPNALKLKPRLRHREELLQVTEVAMEEIKPATNTIYENSKIQLTLVEDSLINLLSKTAFILGQDENGGLVRVQLNNVAHEDEKELAEMLGFGCKIQIPNVYILANGIRHDEPRRLMYLGKVDKMCRFCGEENATKTCAKCRSANYCSKECQTLDWKVLKHKYICSPPLD